MASSASSDASSDSDGAGFLERMPSFPEPTHQRLAARQRLAEVLDNICDPDALGAIAPFPVYPQPGLHVDNIPIRLPVFDEDAEAIIKASPQQFGSSSGEASHVFAGAPFHTRPAWTQHVEKLASCHAETMDFPADYKVVPSRILVCKPGPAIRLPDQRHPGTIATIAVTLPSKVKGGQTRLVTRRGAKHWDEKFLRELPEYPSHDPAHDITVAVWDRYLDSKFEAVISGYKIVLEYEVITEDLGRLKTVAGRPSTVDELDEAIKQCIADPEFQQEIYLLDKEAHFTRKRESALQGRELVLEQALRDCAFRNGLLSLHGRVKDDPELFSRGRYRLANYEKRSLELVVRGTPTNNLVFGDLDSMEFKANDLLPSTSATRRITASRERFARGLQLGHRVLMLVRQEVALPIIKWELESLNDSERDATVHWLTRACNERPDRNSRFQDKVVDLLPSMTLDESGHGLQKAIAWSIQIRNPRLFNYLVAKKPWDPQLFREFVAKFLPQLIRTLNKVIATAGSAELIWYKWLGPFATDHRTPSRMCHTLKRIKKGLRADLKSAFDRWTMKQVVWFLDMKVVRLTSEDVPLLVNVALAKQDDIEWLTTKFAGYLRFSCARPAMIAFVAALAEPETLQEMDKLGNAESGEYLFSVLFPLLQSMGPYFCAVLDDFVETPPEQLQSTYELARKPNGRSLHPFLPVTSHLCIIIRAAMRHGLIFAAERILRTSTFYFRHMYVPDVVESEILGFLDFLASPTLGLDTHEVTRDAFEFLLIAAINFVLRRRKIGDGEGHLSVMDMVELTPERELFENTLAPLSAAQIEHFLGEEDFNAFFRMSGPSLRPCYDSQRQAVPLIADLWEDTKNPETLEDYNRNRPRKSDQQRIIDITPLAADDSTTEALLGMYASIKIKGALRERQDEERKRKADDLDDVQSESHKRAKMEAETQ